MTEQLERLNTMIITDMDGTPIGVRSMDGTINYVRKGGDTTLEYEINRVIENYKKLDELSLKLHEQIILAKKLLEPPEKSDEMKRAEFLEKLKEKNKLKNICTIS